MAKFTDVIASISEMRKLPEGWDYGRGGPVSKRAAESCVQIVQMLYGVGATDFDVVPGFHGSITVFGYRNDKSVEIQCFTDGSFDFMHENGDEVGEILSSLTLGDIAQNLEACGWRSQRFYASCTRSDMFAKSSAMLGPRSTIQRVAGYQSSAVNALMRMVQMHAHTSEISMTKELPENRRSSGEYRQHHCQMA